MKPISNKIGRWQGAGLLATTLLGTGVFILPQMTIAIANQGALIAWFFLTLAIIPITIIFARLTAKHPHAGGPAYFVEQAFGQLAGRSIGIIFLLIVPIGVPAAILMTVQFAETLLPTLGNFPLIAQLAVIVLLFLLNYRGIQISAKAQFLLTLAIISVVILLLVAFGISEPLPQQTINKYTIDMVLAAAGIGFWSFLGVEAMTHLANEFQNPKKDMVPAMLIGTIIVGLIYLGCTYILISVPNTNPMAMVGVFNQLLSQQGHLVIGILGVAGGLSSANVYTASTIRLIASLSKDQVLPRYFATTNRHQVPISALLLLLSIMILVLILTFNNNKDLAHLIAWCNGVFVIIYLASMAAALKLLDNKQRPYIILGSLFCLALAWGLGSQMWYAIILLILVMPMLAWQKYYQTKKAAMLTKVISDS